MGFLKKLVDIGVTAGATVAAMKVAEKYNENKANSATDDVNGDGKVDFNDTVANVAKAASEVYAEAADKVKGFAASAKEKAPELVNKAKETAVDAFNSVSGRRDSAPCGCGEANAQEQPAQTEANGDSPEQP